MLNEELIEKAMEISGHKTKKDVINMALQEFVANNTRKNILDLKGQIAFADGYDHKALREGRQVDFS